MDKLDQLQTDIMELTREERDQLMSALALSTSRTREPPTRDEQIVLDAISEVLDVPVRTEKFLESYGRAKFSERAAEIIQFVSESRRALRAPQIRGLVEVCLRSLASDLRSREIPVSPRTILDNIGSMPRAVDRRFPGYAAAGLLHKVVRAA